MGANNDVTTYIMANLFDQVHSFEANHRHAEELQSGTPANVMFTGWRCRRRRARLCSRRLFLPGEIGGIEHHVGSAAGAFRAFKPGL